MSSFTELLLYWILHEKVNISIFIEFLVVQNQFFFNFDFIPRNCIVKWGNFYICFEFCHFILFYVYNIFSWIRSVLNKISNTIN